jgi:hypothetical protein
VGDHEWTPGHQAIHDGAEADREYDEAKVLNLVAEGLDSTADLMQSIGLDEAARTAQAAADAERVAAFIDTQQGIAYEAAATEWLIADDELKLQARAQGQAYVAADRAEAAEHQLGDKDLSEREKTDARLAAARAHADEGVFEQRADELGDSARSVIELAKGMERMARQMDD